MLISPFSLRPIVAQSSHPMTLDKLKRFMEFESLLQKMGWQIVCGRCADRFRDLNKAGVRGDNDVKANQYRVECSCSAHIFDAS